MRILIFALLAGSIVLGVNSCFERYKAEQYQAHAVRCAINPDRFGCEDTATAAGGDL